MVKSEKIIKEDEFGEYCEIQLAGKKYPGIAKIDPEQFERIGSHKWYLKVFKQTKRYAFRRLDLGRNKLRSVYMHRQILNLNGSKAITDHINSDTLDNRKNNLRLCSMRENNYNKRPHEGAASKYKGVFIDTVNDKTCIRAAIQPMGKRYYVYFKYMPQDKELSQRYEIEAARAYDRAASMLYREFAYLNFPQEREKCMSCRMTTEEENRARKLHALFTCITNKVEIEEKLKTLSIDELKILCQFHGCNVSRLAGYMR